MKKIIVGFDGTDQATDALRLAADLASGLRARLVVTAVYEHPPGELQGAVPPETRSRFFARTFRAAAEQLPGVEFEKRMVGDGTPRANLAEVAEAEDAELLVIGSSHFGAVGRVIAGAAGQPLFDRVRGGVLIAPPGWAERGDGRFGRIGVGYDGTEGSEAALRRALELAEPLSAGLRLVAVAPYRDPRLESDSEQPDARWVEILRQGADQAGEVDTELVLRQGRAATELADQSRGVDLFVVGARGRSLVARALLGSVSSEVVRSSHCPVLVVGTRADDRDRETERAAASTG